MHAMCKISETVSEVNQIRTERHAHALEYLQLPWKPSWRQTVGEARHLMSLFSVFISSSHSPSLLYSICLYISLALSLLCLMSHISVSVCFCTSGLWSQIEHIILMYGVFFCFCIAPFTAAPPPPSPAIPLLLFLSFHTAQTMQFKKS